MISRWTVLLIGVSQMTCWGVSYYLIGALGPAMVAELGWRPAVVYGGFSAALVTMSLASPGVGRAIDRFGGRPVMALGSCLCAGGCLLLAHAHAWPAYYAAWLVLGLAMRMTLYDAAFAALARLCGPLARRPIGQITLLGGLASTTFWPIGHALGDSFGWRGAATAYAGFALATLAIHLTIPAGRHAPAPAAPTAAPPAAPPRRAETAPALLFAAMVALTAFASSGTFAHLIGVLGGLGLDAPSAVWIAALPGIGQSAARLAEILFGARLHPRNLAVLAAGLVPAAFALGQFSGRALAVGAAFALLYGAGNGLLTIVRGTLPLVLFDPRAYGATAGRLVAPSFLLAASGPLVYAVVIDRFGDAAALTLSMAVGCGILAAALGLRRWCAARPEAG